MGQQLQVIFLARRASGGVLVRWWRHDLGDGYGSGSSEGGVLAFPVEGHAAKGTYLPVYALQVLLTASTPQQSFTFPSSGSDMPLTCPTPPPLSTFFASQNLAAIFAGQGIHKQLAGKSSRRYCYNQPKKTKKKKQNQIHQRTRP